jgi:hypothetical protein
MLEVLDTDVSMDSDFGAMGGGASWPGAALKWCNINAWHLGLILRIPMTSILYNGKQLELLLLLAS